MIILLISSFTIYRLFDGWGIFHYASLVSSIYIVIGILLPIFLRHTRYWGRLHLTAMFWSVIGLWSAFIAEMGVRILDRSFMLIVGIVLGIFIFVGVLLFALKKKSWIRLTKGHLK